MCGKLGRTMKLYINFKGKFSHAVNMETMTFFDDNVVIHKIANSYIDCFAIGSGKIKNISCEPEYDLYEYGLIDAAFRAELHPTEMMWDDDAGWVARLW